MEDKHKKRKQIHKEHVRSKTKYQHKSNSSRSSSSESDEWVEKEMAQHKISPIREVREDWMSMTGMLKTYTKDDIRPKDKHKDNNQMQSYNPCTSVRELNPYWKDGGKGLPEKLESHKKSRPFVKPSDDEDYYSKSLTHTQSSLDFSSKNYTQNEINRKPKEKLPDSNSYRKSSNWKKEAKSDTAKPADSKQVVRENIVNSSHVETHFTKDTKIKYLSDEKMNKLAAKLVKAEIMGDTKLMNDLKEKLEAAREYRKCNPNPDLEEETGILLTSTNSAGNSRPLTKTDHGDSKNKRQKTETHKSGERMKYYSNDDKYTLSEMFQQEKYGSNYDDEAQLAKVAGKHKNPNDDLEDIFIDEISKNKNKSKDSERERQRAINQHVKMEKTLDGCQYCVESKNMLKHLIVSRGRKVYLALPSTKSIVKGQCFISTLQHTTCVTSLDEDVWEEIMDYRRGLTRLFNSQNKDVIFYETATKLHRFPHMVINCVPLPRDVGDVAAIYFKKAILECEAEWSMNKKVIDLKGKNIRKSVPKGLPYFWIDFGMDPGFAHVIEDQQLFQKNFAEEIVAGILDLDHHLWKNPPKEYGDLQRKKVLDFVKEWKPFDDLVTNKE